jgi:hypothetical protein
LRILLVLREGEHNVGALAEAAETSQANTSKHHAALLEAGAPGAGPRATLSTA